MSLINRDVSTTRLCKQSGFSLLELLIALSIITITLSTALPSYSKLVAGQHRSSSISAFQHFLLMAKTEANKSLNDIVICPSSDGQTCDQDSYDYSLGWIMFTNIDKDYPVIKDANEPIVQTLRLEPGQFNLIANRKAFVFRPVRKRSTNGTLMICPSAEYTNNQDYQAIIVSYTGRPRLDNAPTQNHRAICDRYL